MRHERPTDEVVRRTYRNARWLTILALLGCGAIYGLIAMLSDTTIVTQARFNAVFQSVLIAAWVLFMFPYISVTLKSILYGIEVNSQMADFANRLAKVDISARFEAEAKKIQDSLAVWQRLGERLDAELPVFLKKVDEGFKQLKESSEKLSSVIEKNEQVAAEARPAIEALKRIEAKVEEEIKKGFFEDARAALQSVRNMGGLPVKEEEAKEDLSFALNSIRKNKDKVAGKAQA